MPPLAPIKRDQPITHRTHHGTVFMCSRADLDAPIRVYDRARDDMDFARDVAEFTGWHATTIWPDLNGFPGYDTIKFELPSQRAPGVNKIKAVKRKRR